MPDTTFQEATGVKLLGMFIICLWNVDMLGKTFLVAGLGFFGPRLVYDQTSLMVASVQEVKLFVGHGGMLKAVHRSTRNTHSQRSWSHSVI